jgi:hypothetical protein
VRSQTVGSGCTLGAGCTVLGDVEIGERSTVGAAAVVTRSIPAGGTVIGVNTLLKRRAGAPSSPQQRSTPAPSKAEEAAGTAAEAPTPEPTQERAAGPSGLPGAMPGPLEPPLLPGAMPGPSEPSALPGAMPGATVVELRRSVTGVRDAYERRMDQLQLEEEGHHDDGVWFYDRDRAENAEEGEYNYFGF